MLIQAVKEWASDGGVRRVSLVTYREVPWNGPWYRSRGFREVEAAMVGPEHVKKMGSETEQALARPGFSRCCMVWEES